MKLPERLQHYRDCFTNHIQSVGGWLIEPKWAQETVAQLRGSAPVFRSMEDYGDYKPKTPEERAAEMITNLQGVGVVKLSGPLQKFDSSMGGTNTVIARMAIRMAAADPNLHALMMVADSPGGTTAGTAELAADIAAAAAVKPCYGYAEDLCASAAYWALSQCTKIFANPTAMIGSIGTVAVIHDSSKAYEMAGVKVHVLATGPLKGAFTDGTEVTEEQLAYYQQLVNDINAFFVAGVAKGRGMSKEKVSKLADGSVVMAGRALKNGLIDDVASFDDVLATLIKKGPKTGAKTKGSTARARAQLDLEAAR